jgi:PAS domain S-box-containing protein
VRDRITANLPARSLDETAAFYGALGFQLVSREDAWMILRRCELELEFFLHSVGEPTASPFSACVRVADVDRLHAAWSGAGLASSGIPRLTEPAGGVEARRSFALVDPNGNMLRCIADASPVSAGAADRTLAEPEARGAEAALRAREVDLIEAQRLGRIGSWRWDARTGVTVGSAEFFRIFGLDPSVDQIPPFTSQRGILYPDESWDKVRDVGQEAMRTGVGYELDVEALASGRRIWITTRGEAVRNETGEVVGLRGTVQNITARKRAEAATRENAGRIQAAITAIPFPLMLHAEDGEVMGLSRRWTDLTGYSREELATHFEWGRRAYPDKYEEYARSVASEFRSVREIAAGEKEVRTKDGGTRVWDFYAVPLAPLPDGRRLKLTAAVDVTERRAAEQAARKQADELSAIYDAAPVGLCVLDRDLRYVRINERMAEINGVPAADHIDRTVKEIVPDLTDQVLAIFARVLEGERVLGVELSGTTAAQPGVVRTWRENWVPLPGSDGAIVGIAISAEEITEERAAAEALKSSEARLRELNASLEARVAEAIAERKTFADIVESAPATIMAVNLDFAILAANAAALAAFERIYGKQPKVGDNLLELLADMPERQAQVRRTWGRALRGEEFVIIDEFGDESRERIAYEARFNTLRDRDGTMIGAAQTAYDVTDRARAQRELEAAQGALRQSQKMEAMGQLTGGVAHDFNNLLTPIMGSLDMLQRRGFGGEREQRLIAGAMQSAERAKTLVQRLLAFARRQPLQPVAVDLLELADSMADLIASTSGPRVKVIVDLAAGMPPVMADPNQLEMAILNLAVNSRDAMPDGGQLAISAKPVIVDASDKVPVPPGRYVQLVVADTGSGMDEETLARAIEPFFSTKGIGKGTGLGLSMVHGLALQLGGALMLKSRVGLGTSAELWLPASSAVVASLGPAEMIIGQQSIGTVLLVDDENTVRMTTAEMLSDSGYAVVEAEHAEDALGKLEAGVAFDILVTDHIMPGMTGTDLAREVQVRRPGTKILIISGYADAGGVAPDLPRLTKPFREAELAAALAALVSTFDREG